MPLDGILINYQAKELLEILENTKIEKIYQPTKDEIVLSIRKSGFNGKLLISCNPANPRINFLQEMPENPVTPPMFCMLMRKHLQTGKISNISNLNMERMIKFYINTFDELGYASQKYLIIEMQNRNSNVILCDKDYRIIDVMRRVDIDLNNKRTLASGFFYQEPPSQGKKDIFTCDKFDNTENTNGPAEISKYILDNFTGISPLVAKEIEYRSKKSNLQNVMQEFKKEKKFTLIYKNNDVFDFSYIDITHIENSNIDDENIINKVYFDDLSTLIATFYEKKGTAQRMKSISSQLHKQVSNMLVRAEKKLEIQKKEFLDTKKREKFKMMGELITANLHLIKKGEKTVKIINYFDENCPEIEIKLDDALSPQQTAAKYFKKYNKAKTAEIILTKQIEIGKENILYLASVLDTVDRASSTIDIEQIREELGFSKTSKNKKPSKSKPYQYKTTDGFMVYVGKNNIQNDILTLKTAYKSDIWMHTQKIHGAHVILLCDGQEPTDRAYTDALMIAAYHSKAKNSAQVPVDYTKVKNVKKPAGAKPGMVIYHVYNTAYVTPIEKKVLEMRI